jgi:hypothetical protein
MKSTSSRAHSTSVSEVTLLQEVPEGIRRELLGAYNEILKNFRERRWEPSELNGGKLCEIVYTILRGHVDGKFPTKSNKPKNMVDACKGLEQASPDLFPRSVRIQIPRMLIALYEIRNNRGVGHVGGDVDPNHMDAICVLEMSKWVLSELIRMFHGMSTEEASYAVDAIVERTLPLVWEVGGKLRVLRADMNMTDKTLVLLYHSSSPVAEDVLLSWVEHSNSSAYRRDVLRPAHRNKLLEYNFDARSVQISPLGSDHVENYILNKQ